LSVISTITPAWKEWIVQNLRSGCSSESIVVVMIENNFESIFAEAVVQLLDNEQSQSFIYENPRFSHQGNFIETSDRKVRIVARFERPCVVILDDLFTKKECAELIKNSLDKLKRSTTIDPISGKEAVIEERTSWGTFFELNENDFISKLDRRISEVMNCPIENGEGLQILNYKVGAEYQPHFDYFSEEEAGSKVHLGKGGQRVSTLVVYLRDVETGGETTFPTIGLTVKPKIGSAVYFEYCNSLGQVDPLSLHGGAPVLTGEKWIVTKWMRQGKYI
jgi:prolyl 4-hydroxylase